MASEDRLDRDGDALVRAEACRVEGNALLDKGDFADACVRYNDGLAAIAIVGHDQEQRATELRLALHLNAALAHVRRGNLASAVDHATGALALDPQNVKALYRRGLARARLSEHPGHEAEAKLARADYEQVLVLQPSNSEARAQLQELRTTARVEERKAADAQRDTFKNIFSSEKPIYEERSTTEQAPVIKEVNNKDKQLVLSTERLSFSYVRSEGLVVSGVDIELRKGWCVGIFGNNASGKTTLARLLTQQITPSAGRVIHHGKEVVPGRSTITTSMIVAVAVGLIAVVAAKLASRSDRRAARVLAGTWFWRWIALLVGTLIVIAIGIKWFLDRRHARRAQHVVVHVSSETSDKVQIPEKKTIEKVIGEMLPIELKPEERRQRVIYMLRASGFQMYNQETGAPVGRPEQYVADGLTFGCLSGGQKHLIYVLRCFAINPDVLVCDELLGGLDVQRQPRVLHMLRRLQEAGTAIFYITTELHQMKLVANSLAFLSKGQIVEMAPADEVFDFPRHPATKDYVSSYRSLPGCQRLGGKLAESYTAIAGHADLACPWLPL